jgi:hypothetical protein
MPSSLFCNGRRKINYKEENETDEEIKKENEKDHKKRNRTKL